MVVMYKRFYKYKRGSLTSANFAVATNQDRGQAKCVILINSKLNWFKWQIYRFLYKIMEIQTFVKLG